MKYYRVVDGVVVEVRNQPHPDCPYSTDLHIECNMVVGNRTDAELATAQVEVTRKQKLNSIDIKTSTNITAGYVRNNKRFSASDKHQTWALGILVGIQAGIDYSNVDVATIDNLDSYTLVDNTDATNQVLACINHVKTWLASGSLLKKQVTDATTLDEINAIVDNRS